MLDGERFGAGKSKYNTLNLELYNKRVWSLGFRIEDVGSGPFNL